MSSLSHRPVPALIVGCGDVGARVARLLRERGQPVHAIVRSAASAAALGRDRIEAHALDLDAAPTALPGDRYDTVFWFAPPPGSGATDPRLRAWLPRLSARRLIYISTSGVYGDCAGRWIDEHEPLKPRSERARRRVDAEAAIATCAAAGGLHAVILRVPGIYGPGRLPVERLRAGTPVIADAECPPTNRIHADDLAGAALAAAERGARGGVYNVADGTVSTMTEYFCACARLLGLPEPPRISLAQARETFTPAMLSFLDEPKRLLTHRLREELGFVPRYPDLAAGLPGCLVSA